MIKVRLHGILAKKFGKEFNLEVKSPQEAIRAISANRPSFKRFLMKEKEFLYKVILNKKCIQTSYEVAKNFREGIETMDLVPVAFGAGKNTFATIQIVAGAIALVAGIVLAFVPGGQIFAVALILVGISLLASGIITLLTPTPKYEDKGKSQGASSIFDGAISTTRQGDPVPVIYGELLIPAYIIYSSIQTLDDPNKGQLSS